MQNKTILIVDDDIDLLMLLERDLARQGYIVETAVSLHEAEEFLLSHAPSIILLDINVNGEDGRQLCWKIKNKAAHRSRVIIMSGYDASLSRSMLFGADDFIAKPFELEFLHLKLLSLIKSKPIDIITQNDIDDDD